MDAYVNTNNQYFCILFELFEMKCVRKEALFNAGGYWSNYGNTADFQMMGDFKSTFPMNKSEQMLYKKQIRGLLVSLTTRYKIITSYIAIDIIWYNFMINKNIFMIWRFWSVEAYR